MSRTTYLLIVLALLLPAAANAEGDRCFMIHHDGTFEEPLAWHYEGVQPPYYGAFGEAFDIGYGFVYAAHLWLAQDGTYQGQTFDLYAWYGGICGPPCEVAWITPCLAPEDLPTWPEVGENVYGMELCVEGALTIGFWGDWVGEPAGFFVGADEHGIEEGHPWTCVAPGLPWPTGWQHPDVIWDRRHTEALGLGVDVDRPPSPPQSETWGAIKSLFR